MMICLYQYFGKSQEMICYHNIEFHFFLSLLIYIILRKEASYHGKTVGKTLLSVNRIA